MRIILLAAEDLPTGCDGESLTRGISTSVPLTNSLEDVPADTSELLLLFVVPFVEKSDLMLCEEEEEEGGASGNVSILSMGFVILKEHRNHQFQSMSYVGNKLIRVGPGNMLAGEEWILTMNV